MSQYKTTDLSNWKNNRRLNQFNTMLVMFFFILLSALIGFSVDVIQGMVMDDIDLRMAIKSLVLSERVFYAMSTTTILSGLVMLFFYMYHDKIVRLGLNTRELSIHTINNELENAILDDFHQMSRSMGLKCLPTLWVAEHSIVNAFSSGYNERTSLVVITRGLIEQLDLTEIKAVLVVALFRIKLRDTRLTQVVSFISNVPLLFFDTLYYKKIYDKKRKGNSKFLLNYFYYLLISIRFMLPTIICLYRFFLDPNRIYYTHAMTVNFLGDNQSLTSALHKVRDAHFDNEELASQEYSNIVHDGIRREAYFFDPAVFTFAQTIASSFSTQPSIEEQLESIKKCGARS